MLNDARLAKVYKDNGTAGGGYDASDTLIVTNSYDGKNRRIDKVVEGDPDETYDFYYNTGWRVYEVRKDNDTDPLKQYVWGTRYIDAAVCRFRDDDTDGQNIETLYYARKRGRESFSFS